MVLEAEAQGQGASTVGSAEGPLPGHRLLIVSSCGRRD